MNLDRIIKRYLVPLLLLLLLATAYNEFFVRRGHWQPPDERGGTADVEQNHLAPAGRVQLGERFAPLAALDARQLQLGWVRIGRFGDGWPAEVVEVTEDEDGIEFVLADGTPHRYEKFDGYRLQTVRLQGDGEILIVYRSQHKRG